MNCLKVWYYYVCPFTAGGFVYMPPHYMPTTFALTHYEVHDTCLHKLSQHGAICDVDASAGCLQSALQVTSTVPSGPAPCCTIRDAHWLCHQYIRLLCSTNTLWMVVAARHMHQGTCALEAMFVMSSIPAGSWQSNTVCTHLC
jgi:hypothetical protein